MLEVLLFEGEASDGSQTVRGMSSLMVIVMLITAEEQGTKQVGFGFQFDI